MQASHLTGLPDEVPTLIIGTQSGLPDEVPTLFVGT